MSEDHTVDSWPEWSRYILKELERLNGGQTEIRNEIHGLREDMKKMPVVEQDLGELKKWQKEVSEVYSPTQLAQSKKDLDELKSFKTKAVTGFTLVQLIFTIALAILGLYK